MQLVMRRTGSLITRGDCHDQTGHAESHVYYGRHTVVMQGKFKVVLI